MYRTFDDEDHDVIDHNNHLNKKSSDFIPNHHGIKPNSCMYED